MIAAPLLALLFKLLLGVLLGAAGGLLGIGGGLIAIPILVHGYGMDQQLAQGTALVMIAPNVLIGFIRYRQTHPIDWRSVAAMGAFAMAATYVAAHVATRLDARHLQLGFALFLIALALYFGWHIAAGANRAPAAQPHHHPMPAAALPVLGLASGLMSGLFTVGGGLVVVPVLVTRLGMSQTRAQGMALALVVPGALIALATYGAAGHVDWRVGLPLAVGGIVSVSWGVRLAHRLNQRHLRTLFCAVLLGTALSMLIRT